MLKTLASRFHLELETESVVSWNAQSLFENVISGFRSQRFSVFGPTRGPYSSFIEAGRRFSIRVREELKQRTDLGADSIVFAYDTGALELFAWSKEHGLKTVLGQMDPNRAEAEMVQVEEKLWPGWALQPLQVPDAYFQRREHEWELSDRIIVNSEWSRQALLKQGVPAEKLVVIPLCYEPQTQDSRPTTHDSKCQPSDLSISACQFSASRPLRVLFLGQVILRKGIQYLLAAARQLEGQPIHFDIVGPVGISAAALASAPKNLTFHGRANRDQASRWYQQSNVFVLPTLSDGFALTQLEAMAYGLPVITTPNCGDVVTAGVDGFIVPPRDAEALVCVFERYLQQPELLQVQSAATLLKSRHFTLDRLAANLLALEASLEQRARSE